MFNSDNAQFDSSSINQAREMLKQKLQELEEYGLKINVGNIRYDGDSFNAKIEASIIGSECQYSKTYKRSLYFAKHGNIIGKTCQLGSNKYTFIGLKPKARKKNALIEQNGKRFVCPFEALSF